LGWDIHFSHFVDLVKKCPYLESLHCGGGKQPSKPGTIMEKKLRALNSSIKLLEGNEEG